MAVKQLPWNDGSNDVLEVEFTGTAGTSAVSLSTPNLNEWTDREVIVTASTLGNLPDSEDLTVKQIGKRVFLNTTEKSDIKEQEVLLTREDITTSIYDASIDELFPDLNIDGKCTVTLWLVGAGGNGGAAGNNWGLYKGGSGGAGANGNIIVLSSEQEYSASLRLQINDSSTNLTDLATNSTFIAYKGGNGGDGGNAGAFKFQGDGGEGGTSQAPSIPQGTIWIVEDSYYDSKAPNGEDGGAGESNIQPNALPDILHSEYAKGGQGAASGNGGIGAEGCIAIKISYKEKVLPLRFKDSEGKYFCVLKENLSSKKIE